MVQGCFSFGDYSYFDRNCAYTGIDIVTRIYDVHKKLRAVNLLHGAFVLFKANALRDKNYAEYSLDNRL